MRSTKRVCKAEDIHCTPVVLGAGAMRGPGHLGLLAYLDDRNIEVGTVSGVWIGALVGLFYKNGYAPSEIREIFLHEFSYTNFALLLRALMPPLNPFRWLGGGLIDLVPVTKYLVREYKLLPQKDLCMVSFDPLAWKPICYSGASDYDVANALAGSCSVPMVMRPVFRLFSQGVRPILVDGGMHHPHPGDLESKPAIISKLLGVCNDLPQKSLSLLSPAMYMMETFMAAMLDWLYPDSQEKHLVIPVGHPGVLPLSPLTRHSCDEMWSWGYNQADRYLVHHRPAFCPA